jgi:diguanylate cyclase (GGDEF)-like protein
MVFGMNEWRFASEASLQQPASHSTGLRHTVVRAGFVAAIFCVNSLIVLAAAKYTGGFAALWSANAGLVFMLMIFPRKEHPLYAASVLLASMAVNLGSGFSFQSSILYSFSNVLEAMLVFHIIVRLGFPRTGLYNPAQLLQFGMVAVIASAISASTASLGVGGEYGKAWISWFGSDLLGLLIFLPCFNIIHATLTGAQKYNWPSNRRLEFAGIMALVLAVSTIGLVQATVPLLFLTALPVFIAVFRFGALGGMASTLIVAVVAEFCTISGYGPIAELDASHIAQIFVLQTYIASQLMMALPIASLLADRQSKVSKIIEHEQSLRRLAEMDHQKAEAAKREKTRLLARDELTGLASRRHIMKQCEIALRQARSSSRNFSVAVFDVDRFKSVNDQFGHAVGDDVLRMIGRIARRHKARNHVIGRIGGEEFLVLMPDTSIAEAEVQVDILRLAIMNARLPSPDIGVTISAGLAVSSESDILKEILLSADNALYAAKHGGRNRLEIAA